MSVNWYWKDKMGTVEYKDEDGTYTVNVYRGNCLCVLIPRIFQRFNSLKNLCWSYKRL